VRKTGVLGKEQERRTGKKPCLGVTGNVHEEGKRQSPKKQRGKPIESTKKQTNGGKGSKKFVSEGRRVGPTTLASNVGQENGGGKKGGKRDLKGGTGLLDEHF